MEYKFNSGKSMNYLLTNDHVPSFDESVIEYENHGLKKLQLKEKHCW